MGTPVLITPTIIMELNSKTILCILDVSNQLHSTKDKELIFKRKFMIYVPYQMLNIPRTMYEGML
jgi:hypothetical protein